MSVAPLISYGDRVWVRTVVAEDIKPYRRAIALSAARIGEWNPVSADDLPWRIDRQSEDNRTFMIHAVDPAGEHGLVGKVNVSNVVRGRFQSGTMGYDSYDPYAGHGLFADGMRLIIGLCFDLSPRGMGLHRLEANVRPGNARSAGVLRSLGFRREGHVRDMLLLEGGDRQLLWRDHDSYALVASDWPAKGYRPHAPLRLAVLVTADVGSGIAAGIARELSLPLLSGQAIPALEAGGDLVWQLLAASPVGAVIEFGADADPVMSADGLRSAGFDPGRVPVVTGAAHAAAARGAGSVIRIDTAKPLGPREVTGVALAARAAYVARPGKV